MTPNVRFFIAALLILCVALAMGCATVANKALDGVGVRMADELINYCSSPDYRRKALNLLINGRLAQNNIRIDITCPQDN